MLRHARVIRLSGIVQGVGFRPFAYRLARRYELGGWVKNGGDGVEIYVEGPALALDAFAEALLTETPPAARIATAETLQAECSGIATFEIRESARDSKRPTVRISPDLPVCDDCLRELFDPADRRYRYPYINCTNCGPRYSIVRGLPYDRPLTTMAEWPFCAACATEYADPTDRRFHAQPVACADCGPTYVFETSRAHRAGGDQPSEAARGYDAIAFAAERIGAGDIVAVKGIGGYHLVCDPQNPRAVAALRERKFRRERPFALMARDMETARGLIVTEADVEALLASSARPIVLGEGRVRFAGVAPSNRELGVMLPYAPLHHLLFAAGAPAALVVTSANRSNEPLAYEDADARTSLTGIADGFLIGERAIARRLDDSVARVVLGAPAILRRARGYAPAAVATLPQTRPILALGGDLKNALALVVGGVAFTSQHVGDLEQRSAYESFEATARDLCATYGLRLRDVLVVHDAHPEYVSTGFARALVPTARTLAVQHHRAHIASVVAERGAWDTEVVGVAFDGTGYGDDGTIWGGEIFTGSLVRGFERIAHLRSARLAGGDAAARFPAQAAAGFVAELDGQPDLTAAPFLLGPRYVAARELVRRDVRCFATTSMGRLFDTVAALLGFTGAASFEGQAAMWLEHSAWSGIRSPAYPFPLVGGELDYRPLLHAIVRDRIAGKNVACISLAFHVAIADAVVACAAAYAERPIACSGGVFQNALLTRLLRERLGDRAWFNAGVPPNDGGLALGQAALAACGMARDEGGIPRAS